MATSSKTYFLHCSVRSRGDGRTNPGNNLHVSGLSHKIDTRDLEAAFKEFGRVCAYPPADHTLH